MIFNDFLKEAVCNNHFQKTPVFKEKQEKLKNINIWKNEYF